MESCDIDLFNVDFSKKLIKKIIKTEKNLITKDKLELSKTPSKVKIRYTSNLHNISF